MKITKIIAASLAGFMALTMSACTSPSQDEKPSTDTVGIQDKDEKNETTTKKALVVYFSYSGNTEVIANTIISETQADAYEIIPVTAYPTDYDSRVDLASEEKAQNARPDFQNKLESLEAYDTIYLGYPCWWGTAPMITFTFLEHYNFTDKTIIPFTTHGGSGFGSSISDIKTTVPDANVIADGLSIRDTEVESSEQAVKNWLHSLSK